VKIYTASPMTGKPFHGIPALDAAAKDLREQGHEVINPGELDDPKVRALCLVDPTGSNSVLPKGRTWSKLLSRDLRLIADGAECVAVLPGWQESRGVRLEVFFARLIGVEVRHYPSMRRVPVRVLARAFVSAAAFGAEDIESALLAVEANR
jgi:hypothetical protein